jgi:hypothetical protein
MRALILLGWLLVFVVGLALVFLPAQDGLGQRVSNLGIEMLGGAVIAFSRLDAASPGASRQTAALATHAWSRERSHRN